MNYSGSLGEGEDTQQDRYLTFAVGGETYGLGIENVKEIVGLQPITPLPEEHSHVKGVINLRGNIIPVTDARVRFGMPPGDYTENTCIIIIDNQDNQAGLIVDNVCEVMAIERNDIVAPPAMAGSEQRILKAIGKVGNDVMLLLDYGRIFCSCEQA